MRRASTLLPRKSYSSQPSRPNCWRADWIFGRSNITCGAGVRPASRNLYGRREASPTSRIVLESDGSRVHLAAGANDKRLIQLRPAGVDPPSAGAAIAQTGVEVRDGQVVLNRF